MAAWLDFDSSAAAADTWLRELQDQADAEMQRSAEEKIEDLERRRTLLKEAARRKGDIEGLNDKCEVLMELAACPAVRDRAVAIQAAYTTLYTQLQTLLSRTEKSVSDHSDFHRAVGEFEDWLKLALETVKDAKVPSSPLSLSDRLDQLHGVTARMTEGQHLLNCVSKAFSTVASGSGSPEEDQLEGMRRIMSDMKERHELLAMEVNSALSDFQRAQHRLQDLMSSLEAISLFCEEVGSRLRESDYESDGEVGKMRTLLERTKGLSTEIGKKKEELAESKREAEEFVKMTNDRDACDRVEALSIRLTDLERNCDLTRREIEEEITEYNDYHTAMQETEKWLLQTNFQLMAHNSLYITTRDQVGVVLKVFGALSSKLLFLDSGAD